MDEEDELLASNQYVWSPRYIDSPIVRFHDGNGDGDYLDVGDNIRYYTDDANYNVTATIDAATGDVVERYVYTAYGKATVYDDDWANPAAPTDRRPALLRLLLRRRDRAVPGPQSLLRFQPLHLRQPRSSRLCGRRSQSLSIRDFASHRFSGPERSSTSRSSCTYPRCDCAGYDLAITMVDPGIGNFSGAGRRVEWTTTRKAREARLKSCNSSQITAVVAFG